MVYGKKPAATKRCPAFEKPVDSAAFPRNRSNFAPAGTIGFGIIKTARFRDAIFIRHRSGTLPKSKAIFCCNQGSHSVKWWINCKFAIVITEMRTIIFKATRGIFYCTKNPCNCTKTSSRNPRELSKTRRGIQNVRIFVSRAKWKEFRVATDLIDYATEWPVDFQYPGSPSVH